MLTEKVKNKQIEKWKDLFKRYASSMSPNRKTGIEVDNYFTSKYKYHLLKSEKWESVVLGNIISNNYYRDKIPQGKVPKIKSYSVGEVMVGIDTISGYFQVESEDIRQANAIYDDLFVFRGLDSVDLKNYALVGQYLELK